MNQLLKAALEYGKLGWQVFPLQPGTKKPYPGTRGVRDATSDPEQIQRWWAKHADANIGLACGKASGVYVIDIDYDEEKRINGYESVTKLGALPVTVTQRTPRGGRHYFFVTDDPPPNANGLRSGIDIRGDGYYVVLYPSLHPNGRTYAWENGLDPWHTKPAPYPDFMRVERERESVSQPAQAVTLCPQNVRPDDLIRRATAYFERVKPAVQGHAGHDNLFWACQCAVNGLRMSDAQAYAFLTQHYNPRCEPPWDLNDPKDEKDFRRKITQARSNPTNKFPYGWIVDDPDFNLPVALNDFDLKAFLSRKPANGNTQRDVSTAETDVAIVLASDYLTQEPPIIESIIPEVLDRGDKFFIVGQSKLGKSFFALQMSLSLAAGRAFLGWSQSRQQRVLMVQFELKPANYWRRVRRVAKACGIAAEELGDRLQIWNLRGKPFSLTGLEIGKYGVVFIDPFYKLADRTGSDENSAKDIAKLLGGLDAITERGPAVGVIHHGTKGRLGDKQAIDRASGSGVIARDFDGMVTLAPHADHSGDWLVLETILRNYPSPEAKTLEFQDCVFKVREDVTPQVQTSQSVSRAKQSGPTPDEIANTVIAMERITGPTKTAELIDRIKKDFSVGDKKAAAVIRSLEGRGFQRSKTNTYPACSVISRPDVPPSQGVLSFLQQQTPQTGQTQQLPSLDGLGRCLSSPGSTPL